MQGGRKKKNGKIKNYFVVGPAKSRTDPGGGCQKKKKKNPITPTKYDGRSALFSRDHQSPRRGRRVTTPSPLHTLPPSVHAPPSSSSRVSANGVVAGPWHTRVRAVRSPRHAGVVAAVRHRRRPRYSTGAAPTGSPPAGVGHVRPPRRCRYCYNRTVTTSVGPINNNNNND